MTDEAFSHMRREHVRVRLSVEVSMVTDQSSFVGFTENISESGIFIATHQVQPVGALVSFDFTLLGREAAIHAKGQVRWVRAYHETSDAPPGLGIRFLEMTDEVHEAARFYVTQRLPLFWG